VIRSARETIRAWWGPRTALVVLFLAFFLPVLGAWYLNVQRPDWLPTGGTNHGTLVQPARALDATGLTDLAGAPLPDHALSGHWTFVYLESDGCGEPCREALYRMRQVRLALGKDMDRVARWLVLPEGSPAADLGPLLAEHPGLEVVRAPAAWHERLAAGAAPGEPAPLHLVDPNGYLMMRFSPALDPGEILDDLKHLLRLSKIG
jgi:cytochrome oxidase Cu insertion factor (SCO1/SenC/PrrC family)